MGLDSDTPEGGASGACQVTRPRHIIYHTYERYRMRTLIGMLVFLAFGSAVASATSIVAVRNDDEIVIGADSKTTLNRADAGVGGPESIMKCKIVQTGNLFFASAGAAGINAAGRGEGVNPEFDLRETVAKALQGDGRISEKVGNLEKVLVIALTRIAEEARQDDAAFFLRRFVGQPVYTAIVGGLENGEPVLMVRTFRLIISPLGSLSFEVGRYACPGDCRSSFITIFEGQTEAIRNYLQQHWLFLHYADSVTAVRGLVELEIAKAPFSVGPPVDILRLTRKGAQWVQRKPLCPDIQEDLVFRGSESPE